MTGLNILSPRLKAGWAWDSTHSARGVGGAGGTPSHPGSRLPCDPQPRVQVRPSPRRWSWADEGSHSAEGVERDGATGVGVPGARSRRSAARDAGRRPAVSLTLASGEGEPR